MENVVVRGGAATETRHLHCHRGNCHRRAAVVRHDRHHDYVIPPYYDSLIGKLIVHGRDRAEALARLSRALGELIIDGVDTTVPLFDALLAEQDIHNGSYNIHWLEHWLDAQNKSQDNA